MIHPDPDPRVRFTAAPGLDEDDVLAALREDGGRDGVWGDAPARTEPVAPAWDERTARRERHAEVLRRWDPPGA